MAKTRALSTFKACPVPGCKGKAQGRHIAMHRKKGEWLDSYETMFPRKSGLHGKTRMKRVMLPTGRTGVLRVADRSKLYAAIEELTTCISNIVSECEFYKQEATNKANTLVQLKAAFENINGTDKERRLSQLITPTPEA